ncbi:zinc carboxypeptidase superfamily protein [Toxoplasma gondii TgCatPRC2]|uniref:Zinc carboxypeptidase superfamily protein n=3 Tax=Toxoplasma gondii TaxID=5811 RepID=A0A151H2U0_TOXGO|nr:zinc carboxypeptidase superfamily protein [Toxoplasma gondii ARI]KYK63674.1 zinc carboxypeptidase superfamily protein [Toxoplasma gondii TgCatPRC2]PIL99686.1 zinc carboxypeptidase superfamily protein [Toxoplasma gondii COUG]
MKCVPGLAVIAGTFVSMLRASAELPHYYHTTPQLKEEVEKLGKDCDGFSVHHEPIGNDHSIEFVTVSRASGTRDRFFLLAGEHSRELISAESALHFLQVLCERETKLAEKARKVLQHTNIQVVVNGNPVSRAKVEAGDFCLRGNENNVDLNRNWGDHWNSAAANAETSPGNKAFSEPETQAFAKAVTSFKPHIFLSVHSGTLGMYMPWAFSAEEPARNEQAMESVLKEVDEKFCRCPYGAAGKEVGYQSSGTCLDFVYDKLQTPLSFAVEVCDLPRASDFHFKSNNIVRFTPTPTDKLSSIKHGRRKSSFWIPTQTSVD